MAEHYIKNKGFLKEVIECQEKKVISEHLISFFNRIIDKQLYPMIKSSHPFYEDLRSDVLLHCMEVYPKFKPSRTNSVFAFFVSVVVNKAKTLLTLEKNRILGIVDSNGDDENLQWLFTK